MDLRFNDDRLIKILRTRRSRAFPYSRDEDASRPSISDQTAIRWRRRFTNGRLIATVDRDQLHQIQRLKIKIVFIKIVLRNEEQARDFSPNSLCILNLFACHFFHCDRNSFPLHLNVLISISIERNGINQVLNFKLRLRKLGMKSLASGD